MIKAILIAIVLLVNTNLQADPKQLEIVGLILGVTTQKQVESMKTKVGFYEIGGFELLCFPGYIDNLLSKFSCVTGKEYFSRDLTKKTYTLVSNIEVHEVLLKGFTKKFGKPTKNANTIKSNSFGLKINMNVVVWVDKKGNTLTLGSVGSKINEGVIFLKSAQLIKQDEDKSKASEKERNF